MSLIRQSLLAALASLCGSAGRFLLVVILSHRLGSAELGRFLYAQWLVDLAFLVASLGVNSSAGRYLAEFSAEPPRAAAFLRRWAPWALLLPVLAGALAVVGGLASRMPLGGAGFALLAAWAVAGGWWSMQTAALVGYQRFDRILLGNLVNLAGMLSLVLLTPAAAGSPTRLFGIMAGSSLLAAVVGLGLHRGGLAGAVEGSAADLPWKGILQYSGNVWLVTLLGTLVWSRGELPLVRAWLGDAGVAHYSVTLVIFFAAIQGITLWAGGIAPHLTALWGQGRFVEARAIARRFSDLQLLLSSGAALALFALGPLLLARLFGPAYRDAVPLMMLLLPGLVAMSASAPSHLLQIQTEGAFNRNLSFAGLASLYAVSLLALPVLGLKGAPLARSLALLLMFAGTWIAARRKWGREVLSLRNTLLTFGPVAFAAVWAAVRPPAPWPRLAFAVAGFGAAALLLRDSSGAAVARELLHLLRRPPGGTAR